MKRTKGIVNKKYYHSPAWKALMEMVNKLPSNEQDKVRAVIRAEAHRELERIKAKQN